MITKDYQEITDPAKEVFEDGSFTIIRFFENETHADHFFLHAEYDEPISLQDINNKYPMAEHILLIAEDFLDGNVYRYNNGGLNEWRIVGKMEGFA